MFDGPTSNCDVLNTCMSDISFPQHPYLVCQVLFSCLRSPTMPRCLQSESVSSISRFVPCVFLAAVFGRPMSSDSLAFCAVSVSTFICSSSSIRSQTTHSIYMFSLGESMRWRSRSPQHVVGPLQTRSILCKPSLPPSLPAGPTDSCINPTTGIFARFFFSSAKASKPTSAKSKPVAG